MGNAIPQVITSDRASGAQVIHGSLKFDSSSSQHLTKTFTSAGNRRTWTWSAWIKRAQQDRQSFFSSGDTTGASFGIEIQGDSKLWAYDYTGGFDWQLLSDELFRDIGWYHLVFVYDTTQATSSDRIKFYINGRQVTNFGTATYPSPQNFQGYTNSNVLHTVGAYTSSIIHTDGSMSQVYLIDGLALGPGYFGYTDPLTGTWRPKKFKAEGTTVNDGTQWSSLVDVSNATVNNGSASNLFDGDTTTKINITGGYIEIDLSSRNVHAGPEGIEVYNNEGGAYTSYQVNGGTAINWQASAGWMSMGGANSKINTIRINHLSGGGVNAVFAFRVNGVTMVDSTTTNLAFGTNGFYLPMDRNSPIGEDKSGLGNNWTPKGFGGSVSLDNPQVSGARPILNTDSGGNVARAGVFGSEVGAFYATTSASNSGGKYYFSHDASAQPTFSFIRGATYTFDYSVSSSHPLRFATAADAAGSTEYTDGTNISGNVIKFTVPHNAPDTLYYYCNVHNGMGNSISVTTDETKADPYAWKCVLALPLVHDVEDISADINPTTTKKAATNYGSTDSSAISNFYGRSRQFDGSNDNINYAANADLGFDGDFTIECFATPSPGGTNGIISSNAYYNANNNWYFNFTTHGGGTLVWYSYTGQGGGQNINATSNGATNTNKMYHVAVSRVGSTVRLFLDGIHVGSTLNSSRDYNDGVTNGLTVGRIPRDNSANTAYGWHNGYIQDLRIYKGVGKYTSNFVVPSTSPDILPDTPSGVSDSSKLAKVTDGAIAFGPAQSDYLHLVSSSADLTLTNNFSMEFFYNENGQRIAGAFITDGGGANSAASSNNGISFQLYHNAGIIYLNWTNGSGSWNSINNITMPSSIGWHHVVVTNDASRTRMFIDGELVGSATDSPTWGYANTSKKMYIGTMSAGPGTGTQGSYNSHGFMSDIRISNGSIPTEYQTTSTTNGTKIFYPPIAALTTTSQGANSSHVKLLCAQSNTSARGYAVVPTSGINDGTIWSDGADPALDNFDGIRAIFDGSLTTRGGDTNTAYLTYVNNASISASTGIRIYYNGIGSGQRYIRINGTTELDDGSAALTPGWSSVSSFSGTINKIEIKTANTGSFAVSAIEIDGTILVDAIVVNGNVAATNFNPFNTDINTVLGQETGYATMNPLDAHPTGVLSEGNLKWDGSSSSTHRSVRSTLSMRTGKYYAEGTVLGNGNTVGSAFGISLSAASLAQYVGQTNGYSYHFNGNKYPGGSSFGTAYGATLGNVVGLAFDADNGNLDAYLNGVYQGRVVSGLLQDDYFWAANAYSAIWGFNFGQKPFKFPPPDGFQPLNAANLRPETVIARPDQFVGTLLYTGDGASSRNLTLPLAADFLWIKKRSAVNSHQLVDTVRGDNSVLHTNSTNDARNPQTQFTGGGISSISGTTATLSSGTSNNDNVNANNSTLVAWSWKAGGSKNTFNVDDVGYANASDVNMSVGALNSISYDQSQDFYGSGTASGSWTGSYDWEGVFNSADVTTLGDADSMATTGTTKFTFGSAVSVISTVTLYIRSQSGTTNITLNDGLSTIISSTAPQNNNLVPFDISFNGNLSNIQISYSSSDYCYISGIAVDGKILVDSGVTPPNVPSSAPTGASVGTKQGFSIIKHTGTGSAGTLPHGLTQKPEFYISKPVTVGGSWAVYTEVIDGSLDYLYLNSTATKGDSGQLGPTSEVFSYGYTADEYIHYLWHSVPGFSKFSKWVGNNSNSGAFIELGFKPALIIFKCSDAGENWYIIDSSRHPFNKATPSSNAVGAVNSLNADTNHTETTSREGHTNTTVDLLSNGFKIRTTNSASGEISYGSRTYIYAAWAEAPAFNLFGAQSNAR